MMVRGYAVCLPQTLVMQIASLIYLAYMTSLGTHSSIAKLATMPAQAILNDPLLASLFHFCTLRALPATFLLTPGSKATTRAKSDGTSAEADALGEALQAFGLTYSAAEFQVRSFIHRLCSSLNLRPFLHVNRSWSPNL